jgi:acyl carrier protein
MAAKIAGAWNLHRLTQELSLDFFVVFSSIASLLGSPGQGNYAAANAFLDSLMHHRRGLNLPGLSINWGPWAGAGMAAAMDTVDRQALIRRGLEPLDRSAAVGIMSALLGQEQPQVAVLRVDWARYHRETSDSATSMVRHLLADQSQTPARGQGEFSSRLRQEPPQRRSPMLLDFVRNLVAELLGVDEAEPLPLDRGFYDLGLDSLSIMTLRNRLQTALGIALPATLAFTHSTIKALSNYLAEGLLVPGTSDSADAPIDQHPSELESKANRAAALDRLSPEEIAARLAEKLASIRSAHGE